MREHTVTLHLQRCQYLSLLQAAIRRDYPALQNTRVLDTTLLIDGTYEVELALPRTPQPASQPEGN